MKRALRTHPRVRGGFAARLGVLLLGLFVFSAAIVLILESKLGLSPWDVLNQGLARHSVLSFGMANVAVGLIVLLVVGIGLIGPASALYIGADLGAGPRDTLMLVGSRRTGVRVGGVRAVLELCALAAGVALGGTFGIGTILFALLVGPIVESSFALLARTPLAVP